MTAVMLTDPVALWEDVLRSYAEVVEAQRSFLLSIDQEEPFEGDHLIAPVFEVPVDMPPMPEQFEAWAASLVRETAGLAELAQHVLDLHPAPAVRRPMARFIDAGGSTMDRQI